MSGIVGAVSPVAPGSEAEARAPAFSPAIRAVHIAACIAGLLLIVLAVGLTAYNYKHAWVSAHNAVMAQVFNTFGLFELGFVPVQNNPPLTASPDAYLHWPPLYPVVLALVFRVFGNGVAVHHLSSVAFVFASAALVWRSFAGLPDKAAAGLAALTFLSAPIAFRYGFAGIHLHLALLLTMLALVLFAGNTGPASGDTSPRGRTLMLALGALAYFRRCDDLVGAAAAAPAFAVFALADRRRQSMLALIAFGCAAVLALLATVWLYSAEYPDFIERLWNRGLMRAGLSVALLPPDYTPHDVQDMARVNPTHPWLPYLRYAVLGQLKLLGLLGMLGIIGGLLSLRRFSELPRPALAIFLGSFSIYALWATLMRNHMGMHEYQMLIVLPAAASGAGLAFEWYLRLRPGAHAGPAGEVSPIAARWRAAACWIAPLLALFSALPTVYDVTRLRPHSDMIALAELADRVLPDDALVVTPYSDMIFVYYSRRHIVRTIESDEVLDRERKGLAALCSDCPLYLAADSAGADGFPSYANLAPVAELPGVGAIWRVAP